MRYAYIIFLMLTTTAYSKVIDGPSGPVNTETILPSLLFLLVAGGIAHFYDKFKKRKIYTKSKPTNKHIEENNIFQLPTNEERAKAMMNRIKGRELMRKREQEEREEEKKQEEQKRKAKYKRFMDISDEMLKCNDRYCAHKILEKYNISELNFIVLSYSIKDKGLITDENMSLIYNIMKRDNHKYDYKEHNDLSLDEINALFNASFEDNIIKNENDLYDESVKEH